MEGKGGVDALEGYETLLKNAKGSSAVMIIQQALKDPKVYVFGELIDSPNVQEVSAIFNVLLLQLAKSAEHKQWLDLLKIFAYGTYSDYKSNPSCMINASQSKRVHFRK